MIQFLILIVERLLIITIRTNLTELFKSCQNRIHSTKGVISIIIVFYWDLATDTVWFWMMPASHLYGTLTRKLFDIWRQAPISADQQGSNDCSNDIVDGVDAHTIGIESKHRPMVIEIQQLFHSIEIYPYRIAGV
ncbi:hypothetical protein BLOT_008023 [Blomia tropicalis]|nr:hypothetical protein BLOT_008023 [Blomia tropicalis]